MSQSSANQRKGRSGRVRNGVCIRLYSEEDFDARPPYTQPEIQRANLAEVILRMKAFRLGDIESFPFHQSARAGGHSRRATRLLQELGALDDRARTDAAGAATWRGCRSTRRWDACCCRRSSEHATRELLIIAAGLSIQDPRERPDGPEGGCPRRPPSALLDPQSDFLTLLNIWNAVHDKWEKLGTQTQRRKFCKAHFLSYMRMREWQDLHAQLEEALCRTSAPLRLNESNAAYDAIHRSILSGLLGHVAGPDGAQPLPSGGKPGP